MTLRNRVLATGEIVAHPARGRFMGNRGILHDDEGRIGKALWKHKAWIICVLEWKGWHREVMTPGNYTELFFLDEAVALAAGHRPCALCRRRAFNAYRDAAGFTGSAPGMDAVLHAERAVPRRFRQQRHEMQAGDLPDGTIFLDGLPKMVMGDAFYPVTAAGYGAAERRVTGPVTVLTPPSSVEALRNGYAPEIAM